MCYTCWRGWRGKRGAPLSRPGSPVRKTGGIFANGGEQKACPFSGSGGRYTNPRPSSPVCPSCAQLSDFVETYIKMRYVSVSPGGAKTAPPRRPKSKGAVKRQRCLTALTTDKRTRAGLSRLALKAPCTSTLTAPFGFATFLTKRVLSQLFNPNLLLFSLSIDHLIYPQIEKSFRNIYYQVDNKVKHLVPPNFKDGCLFARFCWEHKLELGH